MSARAWLGVAAVLVLAACEQTQPDPLAEVRQSCLGDGVEAEARLEACTVLIDSGTLNGAERGDALAHRGAASEEAGDVTAALRDYRAALQDAPDAMLAVRGQAAILIESGQLDAAEPLVQRLVESGQFAATAHFLSGEISRKRGDIASATAAYDRSIAADSGYFESFAARGSLKQDQADYAGAIEDYDRALRLNPQLTPALAGRCWSRVLMEDGDITAARRDADAAATGNPRNVPAQLCRGLLQLRAGEWAGARTSYEAALDVEPGNPDALFGRGVARRRGGDDAGREDMNRARDFSANIGRHFEELGVRTY